MLGVSLRVCLLTVGWLQPLSALELGRTYPTEIGDVNATIWCKAKQPIKDRACSVTLPNGTVAVLNLHTKTAWNGRDRLVGYSAYTDEARTTCGLTINNVSEQDLGQWKLTLQKEDHNQYGFISLLNSKMGFVRDVRLPRHVVPMDYSLNLTAFIIENNYTVDGAVQIQAKVQQGSNDCSNKCIVMHSRDTEIHENSIRIFQNDQPIKLGGVGYDEDRDFLILYTLETLTPGSNISISMRFLSEIKDNLKGFYRSQYFDSVSNQTKTLAVTQFESVKARRAFPCFDEPDRKATFSVGLGRRKDMITLSNMRKKSVIDIDAEYMMDLYEKSVLMPTYLLAFIVCEFESISAKGNQDFKVWGQRQKLPTMRFAVEIGAEILSFYEDFFGTKFPLKKMDMAAIPDFGPGAMENWGLITYQDMSIVYDNASNSFSNKKEVTITVAHELAHQWFGNLVTMEWWDELWLNEGFASYVSKIGAHHVDPGMKYKEQSLIPFHDVLFMDSLSKSHPIKNEVQHPEYQNMFDLISYQKGSALIRMMENFLTTESFKRGLSNYFKKHQYSNAKQDDLWLALGTQAKIDKILPADMSVKEIMETWTLQLGYPVIHVNQMLDGKIKVSQEKFNLEMGTTNKENYKWIVPLSMQSINGNLDNTTVNVWLKEKSKIINTNKIADDDFFIFNIGQMGYYRVSYDRDVWLKLLNTTTFSKLSNLNRAQVFNDAMSLARAGLLDYTIALGMTNHLAKEEDYIVLTVAKKSLEYLQNMLSKDQRWENLERHLLWLLENQYDKVSRSNSIEYFDVLKRELIMTTACNLNKKDCIYLAKEKFAKWLAAKDFESSVEPDSKNWVYCTGIKYGTTDDWNFAWQRAQTTKVTAERTTILDALGCTQNDTQLEVYLNRSIDPNSTLRQTDLWYLYASLIHSSNGPDIALKWLIDNMEKLDTEDSDTLTYAVWSIVSWVYPSSANTRRQYKMLENMLEQHSRKLVECMREVEQALEKISVNIKWRERFFEQVITWDPQSSSLDK